MVWTVLGLILLAAGGAGAQDGSLSADWIEQIQSGFTMDAHGRAMYNSITNNDIQSLALNRQLLRRHNDFFSDKVKVKGITNQKSSGRCWLFASLNSLRPAVIAKHKLGSFEFSQNYLSFWDKMEKANTFLQYMIDFRDRDLMDREMVMILQGEPGDGGYWETFADLVQKYGVVPQAVMPETHSSENTRTMNNLLYQKLRSDAVKLHTMHRAGQDVGQLLAAKKQMLAEVYRLLVINLGEPPRQFTWRYKSKADDADEKDRDVDKEDENDEDDEGREQNEPDDPNEPDAIDTTDTDETREITTTPQRFFQEFVGVDLNDYVNVFNDTTKEFGRLYRIRMSRNMYEGRDIRYVNAEIEVLKDAAIRSIQDGVPLLFAADVSHDQSAEHGIMADGLYDYESIFGIPIQLTKAQRALYRGSVRNHGMALVGVDLQAGRPLKWRVENSWGSARGNSGYWTMYDNWFDLHVYNIVVHKKYLPEEILKITEQPAVVVPPWDPML